MYYNALILVVGVAQLLWTSVCSRRTFPDLRLIHG